MKNTSKRGPSKNINYLKKKKKKKTKIVSEGT